MLAGAIFQIHLKTNILIPTFYENRVAENEPSYTGSEIFNLILNANFRIKSEMPEDTPRSSNTEDVIIIEGKLYKNTFIN